MILYRSRRGYDFSEVKSFSPKVGGAPANVLGAFARLGGKSELITQLGDDGFGRKIFDELKGFNIGLKNVLFTKKANTALAFVSLNTDGNRTFSFYRNPSADMLYDGGNLTDKTFEDCFALHFCSVSLGNFPMKEAHKKAIEFAKKNGALISFDPNLRFPLWENKEDLKNAVCEFLPMADIIKVSDEEIEFITGTPDIDLGCRKLLENAKVVLCTCGAKGAYAKDFKVCAVSKPVCAKDTTGAGDAFIGSFLYSLYKNGFDKEKIDKIDEKTLETFAGLSVEYCSKSVLKYGAIESYPDSL